MRPLPLALALAFLSSHAVAQQPTPPPDDAASIMARVAANQDHSEAERLHYLYVQHARVLSRKGKTIRCEEVTDSRVTPTTTGSEQAILKLDGRLLVKGKYLTYTHLPVEKPASAKADQDENKVTVSKDETDVNINIGDDTTDRDLVENIRKNLTNTKTKDGIGAGLFPLTSKSQAEYDFHLQGREHINNRDVFHITFTLKDKSDFGWKGDAYIDSTAYQPVLVRTTMSRKIPFAVRTLLGTNVPGLGFTVIYAPQPSPSGDIWFPVSFGTEFKIKILFFFSREIVLSAENKNFEQTHVTSTILPAEASASPHP